MIVIPAQAGIQFHLASNLSKTKQNQARPKAGLP
jgi:hypothetical protein